MKINIQALGRIRSSECIRLILQSRGPLDAAALRALESTLIDGWTPERAKVLREWLTPAALIESETNAHAALVTACEAARDVLDAADFDAELEADEGKQALLKCRAALALAGETEVGS